MQISLQRVFIFLCIILLGSIVYSKFLLSISIIALLILAIIRLSRNKSLEGFKSFVNFFPLSALCLFFIMILVSGINSEYLPEWGHQLKMKLPYLTIPFSLWIFKDYVRRYYVFFHQIFIAIIILSSVIVLGNLFSDYDAAVEMVRKGQAIETPVDHIKYSIFLCFAVISSLILGLHSKEDHQIKLSQWLYFGVAAYLFLVLHLLAVRSGLALCYLLLCLVVLNQIRISKRYVLLIPFLVSILAVPFLAYKFIPSVEAKVGYMRFDWHKFQIGEGTNYSDSERIHSILTGIELFKENPLMGTGIGDLRIESSERMEEKLGRPSDKYPHNQFIFTLAGMGILGMLFFLIAYFSAWRYFNREVWLFVFLAILILFSFLVENTLERSYSIAFFCFFYGAGILVSSDKKSILA